MDCAQGEENEALPSVGAEDLARRMRSARDRLGEAVVKPVGEGGVVEKPVAGQDGVTVVIMRSRGGHALYYLQMDSVLYPPIPGYAAHLKQLRDFPCRRDDVWIFGYPKSGNHWLWEVVNMVLKNKPEFENDVMDRFLVDFEDLQSPFLARASRRVLVSHLPWQHAPAAVVRGEGVKAIYVLRNPKDVVVSAYNHLASVTDDFRPLEFSEFLALFMDGNVYYGDWYEHVTSWYLRSQGNSNILIVKYEDMKRDLLKEVYRISAFLKQPLQPGTAQGIVGACTFTRMKSCKRECNEKWREDGLIHSVFRKGQVGDWQNWFSPAESEQFDRHHQEKLASCADLTVDFTLKHSQASYLPLHSSSTSDTVFI